MGTIINSGLTPSFKDPIYKEFYRINDNAIGKYISMVGSKDFYNPGIGLYLSSPIVGPTTTTLNLTNSVSSLGTDGGVISSASGGDAAFFYIFNTLNPQGDVIPGFVYAPNQIINGSNLGPLSNINSVVSAGNHRVLNILQDGTYTFKFSANGIVTETSGNHFHFDFAFYININGNETIIGNIMTTYANFVGGSIGYSAKLNFNIPTFTQSFILKLGDYVQVYGKSIADINALSCNVTLNSSVIGITQTVANAPTSTSFTNPLNIANLNLTGITYYGAERDTLILQGNKLTS